VYKSQQFKGNSLHQGYPMQISCHCYMTCLCCHMAEHTALVQKNVTSDWEIQTYNLDWKCVHCEAGGNCMAWRQSKLGWHWSTWSIVLCKTVGDMTTNSGNYVHDILIRLNLRTGKIHVLAMQFICSTP